MAAIDQLAGLGDLVATCASPLSRNRTAGRHIGTGLSAEEAVAAMSQTAEGIKSVSAIVHAARAHGVEMPISELMDRVVAGDVLTTGQRVGVMKFGSRMDVFVPPEVVLHAREGDRAVAGETVIARWPR